MISMQIKLMFPKKRGEVLVFSLPQTDQYQNISHLYIRPENHQIIKENLWGNQVVVFTLNDVKDSVSLRFHHKGKTVKNLLNTNFRVQDYTKELLEKYHFLLTPDRFVNGTDPRIKKIVKDLRIKNQELRIIFDHVNNFVLEYLRYGKPIEGLYPYSQAIEERTTDCGGFSTLMLSLFQSISIPARLVVGYIINTDLISRILSNSKFLILNSKFFLMHAWPEALLPDGSWFPFDPSLEWRRGTGQTKRQGGFGYIPDDRLVVSYGQDFTIKYKGKPIRLDILQNPIYHT